MRSRALAGPVDPATRRARRQALRRSAAWQEHLDRLGITALSSADPVPIATEGALWGSVKAHGLLNDAVIVSDDAGQFNLGRHACAGSTPSGWCTSSTPSPTSTAPPSSGCASDLVVL